MTGAWKNVSYYHDLSLMIHLFLPGIVVAGAGYLNDDSGDGSRDDCGSIHLVSCDRMNIVDYCSDYSIDDESFDLVVAVVVASLLVQTSIVQSIRHLCDLVRDSDWSGS